MRAASVNGSPLACLSTRWPTACYTSSGPVLPGSRYCIIDTSGDIAQTQQNAIAVSTTDGFAMGNQQVVCPPCILDAALSALRIASCETPYSPAS
jgi:hypothetical protein